MNKILLIDGNHLAHRARHRFDKFTNRKGESSSVVYGGPFMVSSLLRKFPSSICYAAFDQGRASERLAIHPDYKNREKRPMEDNFEKQLKAFRTILSSLNVKVVHKKGCEADDFLYALAKEHRHTHKTLISADKDFIPMLDPYTKIFNPSKNVILSTINCKKEYGFTPEEFTDYLCLKGDKSDHIPGVNGLGDVRIRALLDEFGSIDNFFEQGGSKAWDRYWDAIDEVYDRNFELISLRYFHNKYRRKDPIPIQPSTWDLDKVQEIAKYYSIKAFREDSFIKSFKQLEPCTR